MFEDRWIPFLVQHAPCLWGKDLLLVLLKLLSGKDITGLLSRILEVEWAPPVQIFHLEDREEL